ncbi:phage tail protein, partial [Pseudomonas syringae]
LAGRANGGRISAVAGRVITVDRDIDLSTGAKLRVNLPSGKTEARVITSLTGRRVTVAASFSEVPEAECGWILEYEDLKTMQFLVRNITRPEWHQYQLECIQHEPSKFDAIDFGAVVDIRPISGISVGVQAAPGAVFVTQHVVIEQGIAVTNMTISWDAAPGAVAYDVEWRWGSREWVKVPRTGEQSVEVPGIYSGQYMARVRAVSALNVSSLPATSLLTNLQGKTSLPPAVTSLTATSLIFGISLKWTFPPGAEDTQRTEIWYGPTTDLAKATKLSDLAYPQSEHVMQSLKAGVTFFFWARLVDRTGNVGPWYPTGVGVMGQTSSDAGPVLDLLDKQLTESQFGEHLLGRLDLIDGDGPGSVNERLEELKANIGEITDALVYVPTDAYVRDNTVRVGDNLWTAIDPVPAKTDGSNGPPNPLYWVNTGQSIRAANAQAAQVSKNTVDISKVDGKTTATATQLNALQASTRDDNVEGEMAAALKAWEDTANYAQEVRVRTENDFAQAQRTTLLDARVAGNDAKISIVETAQATDREATAQQITNLTATVTTNQTTVQAAIQSEALTRSNADGALSTRIETAQAKANDATVAVQQTTSALATTNNKLAGIWSVKMELTQNNIPYAAGFGLGLESGAAGTTSQFVVRADTFLVMNTSSQSAQSFFGITGGQTFIRSAFIEDASIGVAKLTQSLQSSDYVAGQRGLKINFVTGEFEYNSALGGGGRQTVNSAGGKVFDEKGQIRYQWGNLSV